MGFVGPNVTIVTVMRPCPINVARDDDAETVIDGLPRAKLDPGLIKALDRNCVTQKEHGLLSEVHDRMLRSPPPTMTLRRRLAAPWSPLATGWPSSGLRSGFEKCLLHRECELAARASEIAAIRSRLTRLTCSLAPAMAAYAAVKGQSELPLYLPSRWI